MKKTFKKVSRSMGRYSCGLILGKVVMVHNDDDDKYDIGQVFI